MPAFGCLFTDLLSEEEINLYPVQSTDSSGFLLFVAQGILVDSPVKFSLPYPGATVHGIDQLGTHPFALSLPFLGTLTLVKVEAEGVMKFIFETFEFGSLLPGFGLFPPVLICFYFAVK